MPSARAKTSCSVQAASDITEKFELERLRDQFLKMAAHELKTPVAVLSSYAELLQAQAQVSPKEQRLVDGLVRGARRIDRIISDLLFLWQLRLGRIALVGEEVELRDLLCRVAGRLEPKAKAPRVEVAPGEPVVR